MCGPVSPRLCNFLYDSGPACARRELRDERDQRELCCCAQHGASSAVDGSCSTSQSAAMPTSRGMPSCRNRRGCWRVQHTNCFGQQTRQQSAGQGPQSAAACKTAALAAPWWQALRPYSGSGATTALLSSHAGSSWGARLGCRSGSDCLLGRAHLPRAQPSAHRAAPSAAAAELAWRLAAGPASPSAAQQAVAEGATTNSAGPARGSSRLSCRSSRRLKHAGV